MRQEFVLHVSFAFVVGLTKFVWICASGIFTALAQPSVKSLYFCICLFDMKGYQNTHMEEY